MRFLTQNIRLACIVLLSLSIFAAAPAQAQTVSGTDTPFGGIVFINGPVVPAPGLYQYSFQFSRPGTGILSIGYGQSYNVFDTSNQFLFGNDALLTFDTPFTSPVTSGSVLFQLPAPYSTPVSGGTEEGFFYGVESYLDFDFGSDDPVTYSFSLSPFTGGSNGGPVGGVPEPAMWAMLILGFGAVGASMRRRKKLYKTVRA
ncbi:MAG: PEPxxWA-CTERM sorting domain-containing protein [Sphingobium sp.]